MLEDLFGSLKSELGKKINDKTDVPPTKTDNVVSVIGDVIKGTATKEMMGGNLSGLMDLFSDKPNTEEADKIESKMSSNMVGELMEKVGITPAQAQKITAIALPFLIKMITKKKNESPQEDSSFLSDILGGGNKEGLGGMAKDLLGGFLK